MPLIKHNLTKLTLLLFCRLTAAHKVSQASLARTLKILVINMAHLPVDTTRQDSALSNNKINLSNKLSTWKRGVALSELANSKCPSKSMI